MRPFDQSYVDDIVRRLGSLPADAKPAWGRMTPRQLYAHLTTAVRYALGKEPETPNEGGFFGRWIAGPLILNGIIKIPKNQKAPKMYDRQPPEADIESLRAELQEVLDRINAGTLRPIPHPFFGDFGVSGWTKLSVIHAEHHARQFGV